jgi:DNA-binding MarR family transcriptional regulator
LEPLQYQFLTLVHPLHANGTRPNISQVANQLGMHHHSAVELGDRLEERGLLQRKRGKHDRRHVLLHVTPGGKKLLRKLALKEHADVCQFAPELLKNLKALVNGSRREI